MNIERPLAGMARLALAAVLCAVPLGCQRGPGPTTAADATLSPDEQVLLTLDCYNPQYKIDEDGHVTDLNLGWRHLPGPVLAEIDKLTELEHIDLAYTTVTDDGLVQLKDLQKLRSMGLTGTPVTDKGLDHLEKMPNLQWVWLPRERVTEAAVERLKEARPDMHIYLQ
ncbi:MAG TPA: hypothetical protein VJ739_13640 [Gemmataceae bacterium]|nr:hypothetical protein [Gemmataceae bacterium]